MIMKKLIKVNCGCHFKLDAADRFSESNQVMFSGTTRKLMQTKRKKKKVHMVRARKH